MNQTAFASLSGFGSKPCNLDKMFSISKRVTRYESHGNQSSVEIRYIFAIRIVFTFKKVSLLEKINPPM